MILMREVSDVGMDGLDLVVYAYSSTHRFQYLDDIMSSMFFDIRSMLMTTTSHGNLCSDTNLSLHPIIS